MHYSTSSTGGLPHLWGEVIATRTNGKLQHIPYKAAAEALRDAVAGHVPAFVDVTTPVDAQIRAGTMRGLICGAKSRVANIPDVPVASELGAPELEAAVYFGVATTAGTPPDIVAKLQAELIRIVALPDVQAKLRGLGGERGTMTVEQFTRFNAQEYERFGRLIREANIKPE